MNVDLNLCCRPDMIRYFETRFIKQIYLIIYNPKINYKTFHKE